MLLLPHSGFPWPPGRWRCQSTESRTICLSRFYCNLLYIWAVWNRNNQCYAMYETYKLVLLDKMSRQQWQESLQFRPIVGFPPQAGCRRWYQTAGGQLFWALLRVRGALTSLFPHGCAVQVQNLNLWLRHVLLIYLLDLFNVITVNEK